MKTEAERRAIKSRMPKTQLRKEHTQECRLLPDRSCMLDEMPKHSRVAEIGVAFGDFSSEILDRCQPESLYLIDSWESQRYKDGLLKIKSRFSDQIGKGIVEIRQGLSTDVLAELEPGMFDWVYIDTNHKFRTTYEELVQCARILGPQGRIAGHDFCTGNIVGAFPYGVVEAVTQFCSQNDWQFEYLTVESHGHFSFCLKKAVI